MKFPKEMILKLKNNTTMVVKLNDVGYEYPQKFVAKIEISEQFVNAKLNKCVKFITEEK